ncbi:cytochrome oxidase assembly protein-domain-containing protein [Phakopsora pachyrhizi]|nr:cytochrome oxidase assembly protein-domain-containing protein [Phakopsora pachyrhizi]
MRIVYNSILNRLYFSRFSPLPKNKELNHHSGCFQTFHNLSRPSARIKGFKYQSHFRIRNKTSSNLVYHHLKTLRNFGSTRIFRSSDGTVGTTISGSITDQTQKHPSLSSPILSRHLFLISGLVFSIVIVGGLTRLTESGLSITEWNLISGILPPLDERSWQDEFEKYRSTPEWKLLNQSIGLDQFKTIYYWEWAHRMIGRLIGIGFLVPIPILMRRGLIRGRQIGWSLVGIGALIGAQGGLGWYMVKSGLNQVELDQRDGVPRVSQYRLAAHLLMAFAVYSACLRLAGGIRRDWRLAVEHKPLDSQRSSIKTLGPSSATMDSIRLLQSKLSGRARIYINLLTGLVFITAGSGAFVAGLDAGLVYNTYPKMGDNWIPPISELIVQKISDRNLREGEVSRLSFLRNFFENPTTVQFDHRVLGASTFASTMAWLGYVYKNREKLPLATIRWSKRMAMMACVQVGLGISTLVYLVPTSLAAAHQAGSLLLLSLSLGCGLSLRRPSPRALKEYQKWLNSSKKN